MTRPKMTEGKRVVKGFEDVIEDLEARGMLDLVLGACVRGGVTLEEVTSRGRTGPVVAVRHAVWWAIRDHYRWSYSSIGTLWGVDHGAVWLAIRNVNRRMGEKKAA
jgi:chromosomal replication initiation ATPase DnaA